MEEIEESSLVSTLSKNPTAQSNIVTCDGELAKQEEEELKLDSPEKVEVTEMDSVADENDEISEAGSTVSDIVDELIITKCPKSNCSGWAITDYYDDATFRCNLCCITHCTICDIVYQPTECEHLKQVNNTLESPKSTEQIDPKNTLCRETNCSVQKETPCRNYDGNDQKFDTVSVVIENLTVIADRTSLPLGFLVSEYIQISQRMEFADDEDFETLLKQQGEIASEIVKLKEMELIGSVVSFTEENFKKIVSCKISNPRSENSFMYKHHSQAIDRFYGLLQNPRFKNQNVENLKIIRAFHHDNRSLQSTFEISQSRMEEIYDFSEDSYPIWAYYDYEKYPMGCIFKDNFNMGFANGRRVYLSEFPQVALWPFSRRKIQSSQSYHILILCKILPGKPTKGVCLIKNEDYESERGDEESKCKCDSHLINEGNDGRAEWIVMFNSDRILPVYELHVDCVE